MSEAIIGLVITIIAMQALVLIAFVLACKVDLWGLGTMTLKEGCEALFAKEQHRNDDAE